MNFFLTFVALKSFAWLAHWCSSIEISIISVRFPYLDLNVSLESVNVRQVNRNRQTDNVFTPPIICDKYHLVSLGAEL